tara:strand:+ start:83 stop:325 length:243 start_codon:yes stop_codon:yes gene_type:complete
MQPNNVQTSTKQNPPSLIIEALPDRKRPKVTDNLTGYSRAYEIKMKILRLLKISFGNKGCDTCVPTVCDLLANKRALDET